MYLIVEDHPELKSIIEQSMEMFGRECLTAANGLEALEIYKTKSQEIDLVITDVVMPGIDGKRLVREILKISPDQRVCFMSGYAHDIISEADLNEHRLLEKPFTPLQLIGFIDLQLIR